MYRKSSTSSTSSTSSMASTQLTSPPSRSTSMSSQSSHLSYNSSPSPRVQLIPHTMSRAFDSAFSPSEREALDNTSFDTLDLSSKDFDFEDIFTYDRPQPKFSRVVEVSSPVRGGGGSGGRPSQGERDWSEFSFSHYVNASTGKPTPASNATANAAVRGDRAKASRIRSGISEMYLRNGREARKR